MYIKKNALFGRSKSFLNYKKIYYFLCHKSKCLCYKLKIRASQKSSFHKNLWLGNDFLVVCKLSSHFFSDMHIVIRSDVQFFNLFRLYFKNLESGVLITKVSKKTFFMIQVFICLHVSCWNYLGIHMWQIAL